MPLIIPPAQALANIKAFRLTDQAVRCVATNSAGSFSNGTSILTLVAGLVCTGMRFYASVPSAKTVKCSLWDTTPTRQRTVDVAVAASGIYEATWSSPYTLAVGTEYRFAQWQNDGVRYTQAPIANYNNNIPARPFIALPGVFQYLAGTYYQAADAYINTVAGTEGYFCEPIIQGYNT